MIVIDGSAGEGGGQIVRSALSLAALTGQAVRITQVRGRRKRPGLLRQHLTALLAAREITGGEVEGATVGSAELCFRPGPIAAGDYAFSVGTAGSACLVLQTVLPILLRAPGPSTVRIAGGTHNPAAPPFEFIERSWLPALRAMGHRVDARLLRHGFFPAGGGELEVSVDPVATSELRPFDCTVRGAERARSLDCLVSNLPGEIAARELRVAGAALDIGPEAQRTTTPKSTGPGNVLSATVEFEAVSAHFTGFGERGVPAEQIATRLAREVEAFVSSGAAVTEHLADQLLLALALGRGGRFSTVRPTLHAQSNAEVIGRFLDAPITFEEGESAWSCTVTGTADATV